ncbi:MAG: alpha-glucosidase [Verrucomicrobiaceae bacterium]|nr:alpha-glucosidase [Verrucomicrobiaceae bacterium]
MNASRLALFVTTIGMALPSAEAAGSWKGLESPSGKFRIEFSRGPQGSPLYRVLWKKKAMIEPSGMGFIEAGGVDWRKGFSQLKLGKVTEQKNSWKPLWGERSTVLNHYRSVIVTYSDPDNARTLQIETRAYDGGVAFRYLVASSPRGQSITIKKEKTEFTFTDEHYLWAVASAQGKYSRIRLGSLAYSTERPSILETTEGEVVAIAEAGLVDFARMRLKRAKNSSTTLVSDLHGPTVSGLPLKTPWRVIMAGESPGVLLENNDLLLNLNEPRRIEEAEWIRPGKIIRDVTLSTEGGLACVDFCVKYGLQFVEFDAGWYGGEREEASDARTVSRPNLDLPKVIAYAQQKKIGVILYVNRIHLERDLDDLLPLYRDWGVAGIKFGFVQHGDQKWTKWMHDAIIKCADYQLMVDVHDEYRMTGWQRTYPNFMTAEGIGGDETRPSNEQVLANMFNRMIAGPADHTFCYYASHVKSTTTHAAQLAKAVCFFSPWQFLFWYDRPAAVKDVPELDFFRRLPTTWDDTRVLNGEIGRYATIARRSGRDWFVGSVNAVEARELEIPLDFLETGVSYEVTTYFEDPGSGTPTRVGVRQERGTSTTVLTAKMSSRGGTAYLISPVPGATEPE